MAATTTLAEARVRIALDIPGLDRTVASANASLTSFQREMTKTEAAARKMASVEASAYREAAARDQKRVVSLAQTETAQRRMATVEASAYAEAAARDEKRVAAQGKLADGMLKVGLGVAAATGVAVVAFARFDQSMSRAAAGTQATSAQMGLLRAAAIKAGADTQYSATEAADGITAMGKAGISVQDILSGGLKGALSLAAAGELDVKSASEIAATALTQFGLSGKDLPHVADLLAAGAGKAQGEVSDLAGALKYIGPVAHAANIPIEQTVGVLSEFAAQGIIGEEAGTGFRGVLLALEGPSKQASKAMKDLGLNLYDSQGKMLGIQAIAGQLHDKLGGLTEAERNQALGQIFGNEQMTAATILYKGGAQAVEDWTAKVNDSGYAQRQAGQLMNNLAGDFEQLKGSLETALISSGSGANGGLRSLTQGVTTAVNAFGELPAGIQESTVVIGGLTAAALLLTGGVLKGALAIKTMKTDIAELGITGERTKGTLVGIGKAAAAFASFEAVAAGLGALEGDLAGTTIRAGATERALTQLGSGLPTEKLGSFGASFGDLGSQLKQLADPSLGRRWTDFDSALSGIATFGQFGNTQGSVDRRQVLADLGQLDVTLSGMVKGGQGEAAKALFAQINEIAVKGGAGVDQLANHLPGYRDALAGVAGATGNVAITTADMSGAVGDAATKTDALAAKAAAASTAVDNLRKSFKELFESRFGVEAATDQAAKDMQAITDAAKGKKTGAKAGKVTAADRAEAKDAKDAARAQAIAMGETARQAAAAGKAASDKVLAAAKAKSGGGGTSTATTALEARALMRTFVQDQQDIIGEMAQAGATPEQLTAKAKVLAAQVEKAAAGLHLTKAEIKNYRDALRVDIPAVVATQFKTPGLPEAAAALAAMAQVIATINGKAVVIPVSATAANVREDRSVVAPTTKPRATLPTGKTKAFAVGGIEDHSAQIGYQRTWGEPESGGEAYIPLAASKRAGSSALLSNVASRFGMNVSRGPAGGSVHVVRVPVAETHSTTNPVNVSVGQVVTKDVSSFTDWSAQQGRFGAAGVA